MSLSVREFTLLFFVVFHIFSCFDAVASEGLRIAVSRTPLSLPFYIAEDQGYFSAEGIHVVLDEVIGGNRAMQQLLSGVDDMATSSDTVIMFNSFNRVDFAVICTFVTSNDDNRIIVRKETGILHPQQMVGKRIGTIVGAASQYYLDTWLLFHGIDPKMIQVINLQPEAMEAALVKGEVDAVSVWEPFPFKIMNSVTGAQLMPATSSYIEHFNLIVNRKLIEAGDDDLIKLLRALEHAQQLIKDNPVKAQAILKSRLQSNQAYVDWIWPRLKYRTSLDQALISTLESEARWARHEGLVKEKEAPNYLEFIYSKPLGTVRPEALGIVR